MNLVKHGFTSSMDNIPSYQMLGFWSDTGSVMRYIWFEIFLGSGLGYALGSGLGSG